MCDRFSVTQEMVASDLATYGATLVIDGQSHTIPASAFQAIGEYEVDHCHSRNSPISIVINGAVCYTGVILCEGAVSGHTCADVTAAFLAAISPTITVYFRRPASTVRPAYVPTMSLSVL